MGQGACGLGPPPVGHEPAGDGHCDGHQGQQRRDDQRDDQAQLREAHVVDLLDGRSWGEGREQLLRLVNFNHTLLIDINSNNMN